MKCETVKIGIDYGNTYTVVSWVNPEKAKEEQKEVLSLSNDGNYKMPSSIFVINNRSAIFGHRAEQAVDEAFSRGRIQELSCYLPDLKNRLNPDFIEAFRTSHQDLMTMFFKNIIHAVESHTGGRYCVGEVVLTHPVDFGHYRMNLLKRAVKRAGVGHVLLIPEPIAAADAFLTKQNITLQSQECLLVFDFGGGSTDVACIAHDGTEFFTAVRPMGNSSCGGRQLDACLYKHFQDQILQHYQIELTSKNGSPHRELLNACKCLKEYFTGASDFYSKRVSFYKDETLIDFEAKLSRSQFNKLISNAIEIAIKVAADAIKLAKSKNYTIAKTLLIGGSSQVRLVREKLQELTSAVPEMYDQRDVAVALGALNFPESCLDDDEAYASHPEPPAAEPPAAEPADLGPSDLKPSDLGSLGLEPADLGAADLESYVFESFALDEFDSNGRSLGIDRDAPKIVSPRIN